MKNIMVITPFYPFPESKRLKSDSKAVYYLCSKSMENENVIIVYYYQHTRLDAIKAIPHIIKKWSCTGDIYQDNFGHEVLLFEHPCLVPHSYNTLNFIDEIYANRIKKYLQSNNINLDSLIVHFPVRFTPLALKIPCKQRVAIIHSFDVERQDRLEKTCKYLREYSILGFRSKQIENITCERIDLSSKNRFLCLSGVPDLLVDEKNIHKPWKKDGVLRIVFAGRLNKNKNVEAIIIALSELKERIKYKLAIIGDGEERNRLEKLVLSTNQQDCISFYGNVQRDIVQTYLYNSDVFILVSHKETLGISYLEALAAGCIVVGSKGRGIDGIVKDGKEAYFVDPDNTSGLAQIIEMINEMTQDDVFKIRNAAYQLMSSLTETAVSRLYLEKSI